MLAVVTLEVGNDVLVVSFVCVNEGMPENILIVEFKVTVDEWLTKVFKSLVDELKYDCD